MASERQIAANRRNARRSTGPKTRTGKRRSSRNALRHGLSRHFAAGSSAELDALARLLLPDTDADPDSVELARNATRAHLNLVRIREVKSDIHARIDQFGVLERAPRSHPRAEIKYAMARLRELRVNLPGKGKYPRVMPAAEEEITAEAMRRVLPELCRIDHYEKRAFGAWLRSLRKLANALNGRSHPHDDGASNQTKRTQFI